jgi:hypothetical protein
MAADEDILEVSEVSQAEVEARKRARAEAEGAVIDLLDVAPDPDEAARVAAAAAKRRRAAAAAALAQGEAAARAAAALLCSSVRRNCVPDLTHALTLVSATVFGLEGAREALRAARRRGHARCVAVLLNAGVVPEDASQQRGGASGSGAGPSGAAPAAAPPPPHVRRSARAAALEALLEQAAVRCGC